MAKLIAIDPGTEQSGVIIMCDEQITCAKIMPNAELVQALKSHPYDWFNAGAQDKSWDHLAIEMVASYGKPVGAEVFQTAVWIGRFIQAYDGPNTPIERPDIKVHLCHSRSKVTDAMIRQRIIDIYGGKEKAIGKKKTPGPLYGIKADVWQALALAITWREKYANQ